MTRVAVLVSAGRHPISGRPRRAARDARALELALGLSPATVAVIHAGDPTEPALRDYLGMGVGRLTVVLEPPDADVVPALIHRLRWFAPDLILAGSRAEGGEDSGLVPYLIAEALGCPVIPGVVGLDVEGAEVRVIQGRPRGQRWALAARLPLVATVDLAAPAPRPAVYARARDGAIEVIHVPVAPPDADAAGWTWQPARRRPKRLRATVTGSAEERMWAATQVAGGEGTLLGNPDPATAASAIWDFLVREGIVAAADR